MTRETLTRTLMLLLAAAGLAWLITSTEWVDVEVQRPPRGAAAHDPFFAAAQLFGRVGVRVERRQGLDPLPPPGARLLLTSQYWQLFPERSEQLRQWVQDGGQLVIPAALASRHELSAWLPLHLVDKPRRPPAPRPKHSVPPELADCRELQEWPATSEAHATFRICAPAFWRSLAPREGTQPSWALLGPDGPELLRVPLGRGSVTAYGPETLPLNDQLLRTDEALVLFAALQLQHGDALWLVTEEARPPLPAWIWQQAWVVVLLALAALALWLWRSGVRFGPVGAIPPAQRRSMREQIAGTGVFLQQQGNAALHAAQLRALQETARARLPGFAALGAAAAPAAIARATAVDAQDLARAFAPGARRPQQLPAELELLEAARRRLLHRPPQRQRP